MLQLELLDETFDLNKTGIYHLSVQADTYGLLLAFLDPSSGKYLGLKQYAFPDTRSDDHLYEQIEKLIGEDPLLRQSYASVACIHPDIRSTLLPAALFDRNQLKSYFEFNHPLKNLDELHYNYLRLADAYIIFPVYHEIANLFLRSWVNASFFHPVSPMVEEVLGHDPDLTVNVHFFNRHFDIIVSDGHKLKFQNSFRFRSDEDILYFILFVFDKLGLDQKSTQVFLSGNMDKFSDRPSFLRRYFKNLAFRKAPSGFRYPPVFNKIQDHHYTTLFKVYHCV